MISLNDKTSSPSGHIRLCQGCDLSVDTQDLPYGFKANCPRCGTELYRGGERELSGNLALAITCLLLFIPTLFFNYIQIRLFGVMIPATLPGGFIALSEGGFFELAGLVAFCSVIAPMIFCLAVVVVHLSMHFRWFLAFKASLNAIQVFKHWVMLDVFLVSIAVSCFKLQDHADIYVGPGLIGLVLLQIAIILLLSRLSVRRYWDNWQPSEALTYLQVDVHCEHCHLSQPLQTHCIRCNSALHLRKPFSIQRTWAYLLTAFIAIFPANLIPISILITNGQRLQDTIFSGVAALIKNGMYGIALIIFVASIVVPVGKILGLAFILICIHIKRDINRRLRMQLFGAVKWIGKWSVMDLFVITIMMTLVDRGQILDFTPGYGALAFGVVVVFTMLAAESLDPRLIWDQTRHSTDESPYEQQ